MTPEAEIAWLAGLLEGEGHFAIDRRERRGYDSYAYPMVQLNMTDRDVVTRATEIMRSISGTTAKVTVKKLCANERTPQWRISIYGNRAEQIMRVLLPYMGERRSARINEILHERTERRNRE